LVNMEQPVKLKPERRLVHLDLKGAPPNISYLQKILPLLQSFGANGLLVEYEDTFPYHGDLQDLVSKNAYSKSEVVQLLDLAKSHNMTVIPLVQTFGHFEFVLKHEKFQHLREHPKFPMTLCPNHKDSLATVQAMVDQVLEMHPDISWFHIGADEVFDLGVCEKCRSKLVENGSKAHLFFKHIKNVLDYIKRKYPHLNLIMWDDMFRTVDTKTLKDAGIGELVEPMVWQYLDRLVLPEDLWSRYSAVFPNIWVGTAFKGATGAATFATNIAYHIENHKQWHKVMELEKSRFQNFRGYAFTGWQRYDHYATLCELLPAGLPCLALCLEIMKTGTFTVATHTKVSQDLGCQELLPLNPFDILSPIPECSFPGGVIYCGVALLVHLHDEYSAFMKNDRYQGWMTEYHIKYRYANPVHIQYIMGIVKSLHEKFCDLKKFIEPGLREVFDGDTIEEWLMVYVDTPLKKLEELLATGNELNALGARAKPPLESENCVEMTDDKS
ncbi:unnamed protein product, partial [Owenia fusiformis]